ncbi:MAG TPA: hypothetical protein VGK06_08405 [Methanosarcina sp.]
MLNHNNFFTNGSNANQNAASATCDFAQFVENHRATLDYLTQFGTPLDRAKAAILLKLASGVSL